MAPHHHTNQLVLPDGNSHLPLHPKACCHVTVSYRSSKTLKLSKYVPVLWVLKLAGPKVALREQQGSHLLLPLPSLLRGKVLPGEPSCPMSEARAQLWQSPLWSLCLSPSHSSPSAGFPLYHTVTGTILPVLGVGLGGDNLLSGQEAGEKVFFMGCLCHRLLCLSLDKGRH